MEQRELKMTSLEKLRKQKQRERAGDEVMSLPKHRGRMLTQTVAQGGRQRGWQGSDCVEVKASGEAQKNWRLKCTLERLCWQEHVQYPE